MRHEQLAETLKLVIKREEAKNPPRPDGWASLERRLRREPWRRATIAVAAACSVAVIIAIPALLHVIGPSGPASKSLHGSPGELVVLGAARLPGESARMAVGYGAVWIAGTGKTYEVDQVTDQLLRSITTPGTNRGGCQSGVAAGSGAVWVTHDCRGVYRIDPVTGQVTASITVLRAADMIVAAHGLIWTATLNGEIVRINPKTGTVTGQPIPIGYDVLGRRAGAPPSIVGIVSGAGALWIDTSIGFVGRIDLATGRVASFKLGDVSAVGIGSAWVLGSELIRTDLPPSSSVGIDATVNTRPLSANVSLWRGQVWVLAWVSTPHRALSVQRIDPADNNLHGDTLIPGSAPPASASGPVSVTAGPTGLWVVEPSTGMLFHLGVNDAHQR